MWDFYSSILDNYWGPGARTAVFLAAGIQVHYIPLFAKYLPFQLTDNPIGIRDFRHQSHQ
jgi:hypothetical protein